MGSRTRFSHGLFSAVLGFGLLSLVFLGSPGCGCGDDDLLPPGDERPERCCCTFVWQVPKRANNQDVEITFENEDASLDAEVTPSVLTSVASGEFETFVVCVNEEHLIGDEVQIVFTGAVSGMEFGRAILIYDVRCEPVVELLTDMNLYSTDCGEPPPKTCCCEFEWWPNPNQVGDVEIVVENVSAGLNPVVTPSTLNGVAFLEPELFDVCVDENHPLGAEFNLVIQQQGGGAVLGTITLAYNVSCEPELVPIFGAPTLDLRSEECGIEPTQCCCDFEWLPPVDYTGTANLTVESASLGLEVEITPPQIVVGANRVPFPFTVCINENHNLLDGFTLVITDSGGGGELLRVSVVYRLRCDAFVGQYTGVDGQQIYSTDCGQQETCCCEIEWLVNTDPDWNPPAAPWTVVLENVDPTLELATVTPTTITWTGVPPSFVLFDVCVNAAHTDGAAMELVVYGPDPTGGSTPVEILRVPMDWTPNCVAVLGASSGPGLGQVSSLCGPVQIPDAR